MRRRPALRRLRAWDRKSLGNAFERRNRVAGDAVSTDRSRNMVRTAFAAALGVADGHGAARLCRQHDHRRQGRAGCRGDHRRQCRRAARHVQETRRRREDRRLRRRQQDDPGHGRWQSRYWRWRRHSDGLRGQGCTDDGGVREHLDPALYQHRRAVGFADPHQGRAQGQEDRRLDRGLADRLAGAGAGARRGLEAGRRHARHDRHRRRPRQPPFASI